MPGPVASHLAGRRPQTGAHRGHRRSVAVHAIQQGLWFMTGLALLGALLAVTVLRSRASDPVPAAAPAPAA